MLNKIPDCPKCGEDEMWRPPGKELSLKCYWCGWSSGPLIGIGAQHIVADGESVVQRIERAVHEARAQLEQREAL